MNTRPIKHKTRLLISLTSVLIFLLVSGCGPSPTETTSAPESQAKSSEVTAEPKASVRVQLVLEFNGRADDLSLAVECVPGATVFDVLKAASKADDFEFDSTGSGETAFIRGINGVENEGASGDNWVYRINGKLGDRGCGVKKIQVDDKITWRLGAYKLK